MGAGPLFPPPLAQAAAFTLLNPHVYLDTVLLVGDLGAQQPVPRQGGFLPPVPAPQAWPCSA